MQDFIVRLLLTAVSINGLASIIVPHVKMLDPGWSKAV